MNYEICKTLSCTNFNVDIMYTDDLAMFGTNFEKSIYTFDGAGNKLCFNISKAS